MNAGTVSADLLSGPITGLKQGHSCPPSPAACHLGISIASYTPTVATEIRPDQPNFLTTSTTSSSIGQMNSGQSYSVTRTPVLGSDDQTGFSAGTGNAEHHAVGTSVADSVDGLALSKDSANSAVRNELPAEDSKVLIDQKGLIKSYLPQIAAVDVAKFAAYRQMNSGLSYSITGTPILGSDDRTAFPASSSNAEHHAVVGNIVAESVDGLALPKDSANSAVRTELPADDSKVLANPKGIIKSYLPQAAAMDAAKFAAYRDLCFAHVEEYHKHQKGGIWAQCRICRGTFRHWNTLQRHLQSHIDFRPFACTSCGRAFYSQSKLKRHAVVHSDVKPYPCPVCDRRLGRTEHLKRHLLVHTDIKPYGCSACAHTTKRLDGIRRHIKRKHGTTGGAEIVGLEVPPTAPSVVSQPVASGDPSEPPKPKAKKKKKKKRAATPPATSGDVRPNGETLVVKDCAPSLMDVAMQFGINDLRMPPTSGEGGRYFTESPVPPPKDMSRYAGQVQTTDDLKQMQLLYQSLARSHASSSSAAHASSTPNPAAGRPMNILAPAHLAQAHPFAAGHQQRHAALQLPHPEHGFLVNSGVGGAATAMPAAAMRYVQTDGTGRAMNPVIFAPAAGGHFATADADMISQYIQSQQRFVPPVWGIAANPNFPNYG